MMRAAGQFVRCRIAGPGFFGRVRSRTIDHHLVHPAPVEVGATGRSRSLTKLCTSSSGVAQSKPPSSSGT